MPAIVRKDKKESFVISLLNIRSLVKHRIDLKFDRNINDSDLILLTETQLLGHTDDEEIRKVYQHMHYTGKIMILTNFVV